jgi:nucleoside-diphosphate-sugar epimerase
MIYMDDVVRATIEIMETDAKNVTIRTSYNLAAISFTIGELAEKIKKRIANFAISYKPDHRQKIADSWPDSIDDSDARKDWNWCPKFDL